MPVEVPNDRELITIATSLEDDSLVLIQCILAPRIGREGYPIEVETWALYEF